MKNKRVLLISLSLMCLQEVAMDKSTGTEFKKPAVTRPRVVAQQVRTGRMPAKATEYTRSVERKFEFSNQSDQFVTVWIQRTEGCWYPIVVFPESDSGSLIQPMERGTVYIFTKAAGRFIMQMGEGEEYRLINETPGQEGKRQTNVRIIRSMPYDQVRDILIVINPDGFVDFSSRA